MLSISELELELSSHYNITIVSSHHHNAGPTNQPRQETKMGNQVFIILLVTSGLIHLTGSNSADAAEYDCKCEDSRSDISVSEDDANDPYPSWRLMWNLLGINLFLLSMVYTVISIVEKFYLERRGFYDFEMEDWRMD